jgi:hypothetical protein
VPGLAAYRRGWGGRVWSWFSSPLVSCALSKCCRNCICGAGGRTGGISKRLPKVRARADRGYHWQGARISPGNGGGRAGKVGWRRMPFWCVLAAIKKLGFCCRRGGPVLVLVLVLCSGALLRRDFLPLASGQISAAQPSGFLEPHLAHQGNLRKPKTRDLRASRKTISPVSCVPATVSSPRLES